MKSLKIGIFSVILVFAFCVSAYAAAPPLVYVNGATTKLVPIVKNYVNFLPASTLTEILKVEVTYDKNSGEAKANNFPVNLKADPITRDGKTYLPVDSVVTATGGSVSFDARKNELFITTKKQSASTPQKMKTDVQTVVIRKPDAPQKVEVPAPAPTPAAQAPSYEEDDTKPFIPRSATNNTFKITVTNLERASVLKGAYSAKAGFQYIVVYFSMQNITDRLQTYMGKYYLVDADGNQFNWAKGISNYWLVYLRPGGIYFGYLTFEIPLFAKPQNLMLDLGGQKASIYVPLAKVPPTQPGIGE